MARVVEGWAEAAGAAPDDAIASALERALARARAERPEVSVDPHRFGAELARRGGDPASLATSDLYLSIAWTTGDPASLRILEEEFVPVLRSALAASRITPAEIDDVLQEIRLLLVDGADGAAPRVLQYSGRGRLVGFLRVAASRLAFRRRRRQRSEGTLDEERDGIPDVDLELRMLRDRYGAAFRDAFRGAFASLAVGERLLLRQRFRLGMTVAELGVQQGVHAATISRRVTDARERLLSGIRERMMSRFELGRAEVSSILRLIHDQVDVTLSTEASLADVRHG